MNISLFFTRGRSRIYSVGIKRDIRSNYNNLFYNSAHSVSFYFPITLQNRFYHLPSTDDKNEVQRD